MTHLETQAAPASASDGQRGSFLSAGLAVIDDLMAGGEMLPAQLPAATQWTPERKLAAAVLASALVEVRDHHGSPGHRRRVEETLQWIAADETDWPFSFVRLCELFGLEVEWVRGVVANWVRVPIGDRKPISFLYRQAA
jgi:hypothetical protein